MKRYEGLFILNAAAAKEEALKDTIDKISTEISAAGGKVETVQKMDKKSFARVADRKTSRVSTSIMFLKARRISYPSCATSFPPTRRFSASCSPCARARQQSPRRHNSGLWPASTKSSWRGI